MQLLYTATLIQEDFYNTLVWHLAFILTPILIASLFSRFKLLYLFSLLMFFIFLFDTYGYLKYKNNVHQLLLYKNNKNVVIEIHVDNQKKYRYEYNNINFESLKLDTQTDVSVVGKGSFRTTSSSISYFDRGNIYTLLSTKNRYDSKYILYEDLEKIYEILKK